MHPLQNVHANGSKGTPIWYRQDSELTELHSVARKYTIRPVNVSRFMDISVCTPTSKQSQKLMIHPEQDVTDATTGRLRTNNRYSHLEEIERGTGTDQHHQQTTTTQTATRQVIDLRSSSSLNDSPDD
ncbi:unnamed protein product [Phytophthora fragariaefolia]|uniref:Unnamed protein product n=1 Tax=Phytophthora fragariaefolia TaxID=1490495 RepID=A0A9W6TZ46_9STRA|nr:unnamed protein product [Phytophthora fragariaefolia]